MGAGGDPCPPGGVYGSADLHAGVLLCSNPKENRGVAMSHEARPPRWTTQEMDDFERARALLSALIAAYSARIGRAPSRESSRTLRAERAPLVEERDRLTAGDQERIAEILRSNSRKYSGTQLLR